MQTEHLMPDRAEIQAEAHSSLADIHCVEIEQYSPVDITTRAAESFRFDLSLTPSFPNAELSFVNHWPQDRFETAGKLFLIPPNQDVRIRSDPGGRQLLVICQCRKEVFQNLLDDDFEWTERRLRASSNITNAAIRQLLVNLGAEVRHPGFASATMIDGGVLQIAAHLSRQFAEIKESDVRGGGLSSWRLRAIEERLQDMEPAPSLTELAHLVRLSVRQLTRGFRISRGGSIGAYVADKRILKAKTLLAGGLSVKTVAHGLGFSSASSFSYAFRRATGVTPRDFKRGASRER
jgi:AraC family transcriptional regulator